MTSATDVARNGSLLAAVVADTDHRTTASRRVFLAQAAFTAVLPIVAAPASALEADPIFAAIEQHRMATTNLNAALRTHSTLEDELPKAKRRSNIDCFEESIVETDDPRWITSQRAIDRGYRDEEDAALGLLNVLPSTSGGVVALLQYAVAANGDGETWRSELTDDDGSTRSWHHLLIANLAEILPAMMR